MTVAIKAPLRGLLDRHQEPSSNYLPAFCGWVVQANWADLQPTQGGPIAANNVLDQAIARVRVLNATRPVKLGLKLRCYAGQHAPTWAKNLGGAAMELGDPDNPGTYATVGRWWTTEYMTAYIAFQAKLAAKYDSVPELREVIISSACTLFAEPFIRDRSGVNSNSQTNRAVMLAAGLTTAKDLTAHQVQIYGHLNWQQTRSALACSPYQDVEVGTGSDITFTAQVMAYLRTTLGKRGILENNSIRYPDSRDASTNYPTLYAVMRFFGAPLAYQTATLATVGDLLATIRWAWSQGANSVELPSGYNAYTPAQLQAVAAEIPTQFVVTDGRTVVR